MRTVTRTVTTEECPWLEADVTAGTEVFPYHGCTYGCIGPNGVAVSLVANQTPFFELPIDALDREPQPSDGPDYGADHAAWEIRNAIRPPVNHSPRPVQSVITTHKNSSLIAEVAKLYIQPTDLVLDATYGKGKWWDEFRPERYLVTNDLDPSTKAACHFDFREFPVEWAGLFDVVAFDPPYIAKGGRETSGIKEMDARYGLYDAPKTPAELWRFIGEGIHECARVLNRKGRLLVKAMDYISSGRYQSGYVPVVQSLEAAGLRLEDVFIHHSRPGPQPPGRRQVHSRRSHSYLFVGVK